MTREQIGNKQIDTDSQCATNILTMSMVSTSKAKNSGRDKPVHLGLEPGEKTMLNSPSRNLGALVAKILRHGRAVLYSSERQRRVKSKGERKK
jgi:hypothetical protein